MTLCRRFHLYTAEKQKVLDLRLRVLDLENTEYFLGMYPWTLAFYSLFEIQIFLEMFLNVSKKLS
jgi:hypothetical protein